MPAKAASVGGTGSMSPAHGHRRRAVVERLEPRQLLAGADVWSDQMHAAWFADVGGEAAAAATASASSQQEWLVQLTPAALAAIGDPGAAGRFLADAVPGARVLRGLGEPGQLLVSLPDGGDAATMLAFRTEVASVEPNSTVQAAGTEPNDPLYLNGSLWGLANQGLAGGRAGADIDAPLAWEMSVGSAEVVVAVIDGGIDISHPDLAPNAWRNPGEVAGNGIDDDGNGFVDDVYGWDFRNRNGSVFDSEDNDHGTQVAGIIAARGDNGLGMVGASWNTRIMPLKFIGSGGGSTADAISAINYATMMRQRGVNLRVVNLSWGSSDSSRLLEQAIVRAGEAGILVVASAGNSGLDQDSAWSPNYPSGFASPNLLAVAATDRRDQLAGDSNYGATRVDLAAPGVAILSTVPGRSYAANSGTSFAAPFVSGVAALAASLDPSLSVGELRQAILAGAEPVPALAGRVATGGRLNAFRTLAAVIADDPGYAGREFLTAAADEIIVDSLSRAGPRQLVIRGTGKVVIDGTNQHTGGTVVESGTLVVRNPAALGSGELRVLTGSEVVFEIGTTTALIGGLDLEAGGRIDLGAGGMVLTAAAVNGPMVRDWIVSGRASGGGVGIVGSSVDDEMLTIGYSSGGDGGITLLVTAPGDLDLDHDVDILDLVAFAASGRLGTGQPADWSQGDIDHDGLATVFDLVGIVAAGGYAASDRGPAAAAASGDPANGPAGSLGADAFARLAVAWDLAVRGESSPEGRNSMTFALRLPATSLAGLAAG
jgi:autotransporter-associated beta strand protein